jgi:replicative DNA helicase
MNRIPPQATEIEEIILGSMLFDAECVESGLNLLTADTFYNPSHGIIFDGIKRLHSEGKPIDSMSVEVHLKSELDTEFDIHGLTRNVATPDKVEYYCQIVRDKWISRSVISKCTKLVDKAFTSDTVQVIDELNTIADTIDTGAKTVHSLKPSQIFEREKNSPLQETVLTGDRILDTGMFEHSGMKKGHVNLIMGESKHGKTRFARYLIECVLRKGAKVLWFQLEDYDVNTAKHFERNVNSQMDNLYICQDLYDIEDMKREARIVNREVGLDVIVFDYVQNINCDKRERANQVEYISQQLTRMAKDLNVVVVVLSQVTISGRFGWEQEPRANDVRWSKQLKQDAHAITSVFRPAEVDGLAVNDKYVKDWKGMEHPVNSVWIRQCATRYGEKDFRRYHMIDSEIGLKPYSGF